MPTIRASCYMGLNGVLRDVSLTGLKPWVILVSSNEMSARSAMFDESVLNQSYGVPSQNILRIECFDGDPFDYPGAELFNEHKARQIQNFLSGGFWQSGCDLVVACPTGISISPSIATGIYNANPGRASLLLHPHKPPRFSNLIARLMAQHCGAYSNNFVTY